MNEETEVEQPTELETLKVRADLLGIKYHHNVGVDRLKVLISNAVDNNTEVLEAVKNNNYNVMSHKEYQQLELSKRKKNAGRLVRVRITCMNPNKKEWEGEIFSVGSSKIGTFKKYIPFNVEEGWHIPHIMYEALKERKCTVFHTVKDHLGNKVRKGKLVPEFNIEILPPLTKAELKELAQRQAMSGSIDNV